MLGRRSVVAITAAAGMAGAAQAQTVSGETVVREGDALSGSTVTSVNAPFTNGNGQVGLVLVLEDGRRGVWYDNGLIFTSDSLMGVTLTSGESTMGIGNNGEFVYSPSIDGGDGLVSDQGVIATDNQPAADFDPGFNNTFHSRPTMTDDGTIYWVSGTNDGMGGTSTQNRILYQRLADGTTTGLLRAGDNIGGGIVGPGGGIDFDYAISGDNSQRLFIFNDSSFSSSADGTLTVNGAVIAREGTSSGSGDNWDNFDAVSINNAGNYVFSGDTDGSTAADEFIAYNGVIGLREGDSAAGGIVDGSVDALSLNNLGEAAFVWELDTGAGAVETLFYASDASDLAGSTIALLSVGDGWDETGDGVADWIIEDFNASAGIGPGLDFAENGVVYVEVDLGAIGGGGDSLEAIIRVTVPAPGAAVLVGAGGVLASRRRR